MYPICVECLQTAFYTDWVHLRVIVPTIFAATFMYPICVECLQSAFYTDWVQETISKNAKITFSQKYTQSVQKACTQVYASILHRLGIQSFLAFFEDVPNLCRMLAHRYMQAFYTDWVHKIDPHTFSTRIGYILKNVPNLCRMLAHKKYFYKCSSHEQNLNLTEYQYVHVSAYFHYYILQAASDEL